MELNEIRSKFPDLSDITYIGKGGYKKVYKAASNTFGLVALKIINTSTDKDEIVERIKREIRATEIIDSSHIPKIYNKGNDLETNDYIWIVEQWIDGKTLRDYLSEGKKYTIIEIYNFLEVLLQIIIKAEKCKIIHRDINPNNIMIDTNNKIWLIDFGISRHLDLNSITATNTPFAPCTIGYASAEQFRNRKKEIDSRTDLFSIGVVAYEMITGENFYIKDAKDAFQVIYKIEKYTLPVLKIQGDPQFLLANFIKTLADNRLSRRPSSAYEAYEMLLAIKSTLTL